MLEFRGESWAVDGNLVVVSIEIVELVMIVQGMSTVEERRGSRTMPWSPLEFQIGEMRKGETIIELHFLFGSCPI